MKKIPGFILMFIGLIVFTAAASFAYHIAVEKLEKLWLLYSVLIDIERYFPLVCTLSVVWTLVFRSKGEMSTPNQKSGVFLNFIFYTIFGLLFAFANSELAIPKIYENASYQSSLEAMGIKQTPPAKATTLSISPDEFQTLKGYPVKNNVVFMMGRTLISVDRMVNTGGNLYLIGVHFIGYTTNDNIGYILTGRYAKYVDGNIRMLDSVYYEVKDYKMVKSIRIDKPKDIPTIFDIRAAYALHPADKHLSLIDLFIYNDFIFASRINYFQLGNLVYNKIGYYSILILMLIFSVSVSWALRNQRLVGLKDGFQIVSFYLVSFLVVALGYDLLANLFKAIYSIVL